MRPPSRAALAALLAQVLPGTSRRISELREEILDFSASPSARTVLLKGPIGSGKSTVARAIAMLKRIAPLTDEHAKEAVESIRFEGPNLISLTTIPWYVELALTGLVPELADMQLFGAVKGAYTGATDRAGVFELAMFGRRRRGVDEISEATEMTGGIVFLDEIGDLVPAHQAKLLPVLSGGAFYRVGAEGNPNQELTFRGILIAASWKDLRDGTLRPDLLSRIGAYTLTVPSLYERMEDFEAILEEVERSVRNQVLDAIDRITRVEPLAAMDYWAERRNALQPLDVATRHRLAQIDWSRHGNLRGLTAVVEQIVAQGLDPEHAVSNLQSIEMDRQQVGTDVAAAFLDRLRDRSPSSEGLAGHIAALEQEARTSIRERLQANRQLFAEIGAHLGIPSDTLAHQVQQLARLRRKSS